MIIFDRVLSGAEREAVGNYLARKYLLGGISVVQDQEDPAGDPDGDGLSNHDEAVINGTNPVVADTDGDGIPDGWETTYGLLPRTPDSQLDPDADGLSNLVEFRLGRNPYAGAIDDAASIQMRIETLR